MTIFVQSLSRLYKIDKISLDKLNELLENKKITQEEYDYIISKK
ncbi:hypothetical protein [Faecalibacillus intestinalis]|nr:hypothetical protein [Faecalibacillus intestinalis]MEE1445851.1 hypothetical protein [Faecalibacillus intestinalis]